MAEGLQNSANLDTREIISKKAQLLSKLPQETFE